MELFYSRNIANGFCQLDLEESRHCAKVLRHAEGDVINVIDGEGSLFQCKISRYKLFGSDPRGLYLLDQEYAGRLYAAPTLVL